ncbi:hypothetical protein FNV43_RR07669 [Rhamnella rubrinervis]|uniref:Tudor domain-containing protein n=1 Tax=Rhamnella rubrinervis TaxID=2594499 RepID=A0A8K0HH08_9ROSA|nr:hypothetical protein FNV43_RR07669 [Rhamnella rubrinervis]
MRNGSGKSTLVLKLVLILSFVLYFSVAETGLIEKLLQFPQKPLLFRFLANYGAGSISDTAAGGDDSNVKVTKLAVISDIVEMSVNDHHHSTNRALVGLHRPDETSQRKKQRSSRSKRWVRLCIDKADPKAFVGLRCKVYWPRDAEWYSGRVVSYTTDSNRHHVVYDDGDEEKLKLWKQQIKFYVSGAELETLNLSRCHKNMNSTLVTNISLYNKTVVSAASLAHCREIESGDVTCAKPSEIQSRSTLKEKIPKSELGSRSKCGCSVENKTADKSNNHTIRNEEGRRMVEANAMKAELANKRAKRANRRVDELNAKVKQLMDIQVQMNAVLKSIMSKLSPDDISLP